VHALICTQCASWTIAPLHPKQQRLEASETQAHPTQRCGLPWKGTTLPTTQQAGKHCTKQPAHWTVWQPRASLRRCGACRWRHGGAWRLSGGAHGRIAAQHLGAGRDPDCPPPNLPPPTPALSQWLPQQNQSRGAATSQAGRSKQTWREASPGPGCSRPFEAKGQRTCPSRACERSSGSQSMASTRSPAQ
jgi:hypothetical protein